MKRLFAAILVTGALFVSLSAPVQAVPMGYSFEYEFATGEILSGMLEGELQVDLDTVLVSSLGMVSFSGLPGTGFQTEILGGFNIASLSGLNNNLGTIAPAGVLAGFGLVYPDPAVIGIPGNFGYRVETFDPGRWSLAAKSVPVPATLALMALGVAGLGWVRRKAEGTHAFS